MSHQEVISAFLDNESFNADELGQALADPTGRELLLDLMALRKLVLEDHAVAPSLAVHGADSRRRMRGWWLGSAAAVIAAVAGGFVLGSRRAAEPSAGVQQAAPAPTEIVKLEQWVNWRESQSPKGGK